MIHTQEHYLQRVKWVLMSINEAKNEMHINMLESIIEKELFQLILAQTKKIYLAQMHVSELLQETLYKRCEILATQTLLSNYQIKN